MLGTKIREMRQKRDLTLSELAEKTGVTASYLSQLERNIIDPSLSSLRKISLALDVPIHTFLEDEEKFSFLIKADLRRKLDLPNSAITYEFLTPMASNKSIRPKMEIVYFRLDSKSFSSNDLFAHTADESIYVVKGELVIFLGEEKYRLKEGDCIYIAENIPHRFYNPGETEAIGISAVCPPIY